MGNYSILKDLKMPQLKEKTFDNVDFEAFGQKMTEAVRDAIEKYWEKDIKIYFQSINDFKELREEKTIKGLNFFSSKILVEKHRPVVFRLSKEFIDGFFDSVLMKNETSSKLEDLTKLELKILNNFCEFIYKKLKSVLIPSETVHVSQKSENKINLIYNVELENSDIGKIIISIPSDRVDMKKLSRKVNFKDEDFLTSYATVNIKAGSSKITLDELKNLAAGDIVLLENSSMSSLTLISGNFKKKFNVKVDSSLILNVGNNEDGNNVANNNEVTMASNLWDDIQIEINAEFEKVKMTIGELKQITQGQIVDLGSVFDNEISLFVEDKRVATGELLIVNNRYAVKLNKIIVQDAPSVSQKEIKPQQAEAPEPPKQAKPQPKPQPQKVEDEEFDYSDFEK